MLKEDMTTDEEIQELKRRVDVLEDHSIKFASWMKQVNRLIQVLMNDLNEVKSYQKPWWKFW